MFHAMDDDKRFELTEILLTLAQDQLQFEDDKKIEHIIEQLEQVYESQDGNRFRHFYSDFFPLLVQINENPERGNIDILVQNLSILVEKYQEKKCSARPVDIQDNLIKLYDHINLDAARLKYHLQQQERVDGKIHEVVQKINTVNEAMAAFEEKMQAFEEKMQDVKADLESHERRLKESERNYVTILGIFASIVLAATGGIAFSTSVLENIDAVRGLRLGLIAILLAFTLLNLVYLLVRFILEVNKEKGEKIKYPVFLMVFDVILVLAAVAVWKTYH